jgi:hypothetical protein
LPVLVTVNRKKAFVSPGTTAGFTASSGRMRRPETFATVTVTVLETVL